MADYTLHEDPLSGNCFKIKLTAALLGVPLAIRQYDIRKGETRTPEFLRDVNANGRIPVLQIDGADGTRFLPESNAACWYLADGSALIPDDRFERADMLRWMFWEQYNHEPNIATLRFWLAYVGETHLSEPQRAMLPAKRIAGEDALALMDEHLEGRDWFVGDKVTLADRALRIHPCCRGRRVPLARPAQRVRLARSRRRAARLRADALTHGCHIRRKTVRTRC